MEQDSDHFYLKFTVCVVISFYSVRFFCKYILLWSEVITVTTMALLHHALVVIFSICFNSPYLSILQDGFLFRIADCSALSFHTDEVYYTGIIGIVYLALDSVYAIITPASRGEKPIDWLLLFHHFNGVVLIFCALYAGHGLYMVNTTVHWEANAVLIFLLTFVLSFQCRFIYLTLWKCPLFSSGLRQFFGILSSLELWRVWMTWFLLLYFYYADGTLRYQAILLRIPYFQWAVGRHLRL